MKLSFIVPVYNVEQYVERCIRSLEFQDISKEEYEIIVVNDGTKDQSVQIINNLIIEFPNIIIVEKENGGLSSARNYGLKYARGEYIWFIDSDDYIEPNILNSLLKKLFKNNLDLISFNCYDVWSHKKTKGFNSKNQPVNEIVSGETYIKNYHIGISAWNFIVKREILNKHNISFIEGIIHEDYDYTLHLFKYVKKMTFEDKVIYNYFHREGSITTTNGSQQTIKSIHSWEKIIEVEAKRYDNNNNYDKEAIKWVNNHKFYSINRLFFAKIPYKIKLEEYKKLKAIGAFNIGKTHLDLERKLRCKLLCSKWFFKLFMRFFR